MLSSSINLKVPWSDDKTGLKLKDFVVGLQTS